MSQPSERPHANRSRFQTAQPAVIAHRGFAGVYPENTVGAVREAAGAPSSPTLEIDVRPTADGEIVVFHDDTPARLTDAPPDVSDRPLWELPYATLESLEVLGSGEGIPRLTEVLDAIPADVRVNVEFKHPGTDEVRFAENLPATEREAARDRWLGFATEVLETVDRSPNDVFVSSFFEGALAAVREVDPTVPVAWIFYESVEDDLAVARRYDCEAIHPPWSMFPDTSMFNEAYTGNEPYAEVDLVGIAAEEAREVNAWTVDTWHQATELGQAGVDGIITDYPGLYRYGAPEGGSVGNAGQSPSSATE